MHIKVDEDIPPVAATWLHERGYEASTVVEQSMGGWKDASLWQPVQTDKQFLLTADKGFGDIRAHPPGSHAVCYCYDQMRTEYALFSIF